MNLPAASASLLLILSCSVASALVIPARKDSKLRDEDLAPKACNGVPVGLSVCHPYHQNKYIECTGLEKNVVKKCADGTQYDYNTRFCLPQNMATPCPYLNCPVTVAFGPGPPGESDITLGPGPVSNGNHTFVLEQGRSAYFSPDFGKCLLGQYLRVHVMDTPPPPGYQTRSITVDWSERAVGGHNGPDQLPQVVGWPGDEVLLKWTGIESWARLDINNPRPGSGILPYLPQPVYQCPQWPQGGGVVAGETRLKKPSNVPWVFNLTVDSDLNQMLLADPTGASCRLGMIFKLYVTKRNPTVPPRQEVHPVLWRIADYQNFADLIVQEGDIIQFSAQRRPGPVGSGSDQQQGLSLLTEEAAPTLFKSHRPPPVG